MGIRGLFGFVREYAPDAISERKLSDYAGQCVAVDATLAIYQWHSAGIRAGININHLQGLFFRSIRMMLAGILPIFVFDGPAPASKNATLLARRRKRLSVPRKIFDECRELLDLFGMPMVVARGEADPLVAAISAACMTDDSDALPFGAKYVLRYRSKDAVDEISLERVLKGLGLNYDEFVDMCVLMGSDHTDGHIPGIGPQKARALIKEHKTIEGVLRACNISRPRGFDYETARRVFLDGPADAIAQFRDCELRDILERCRRGNVDMRREFRHVDVAKIKAFLVGEHSLDSERVERGLARLDKLKLSPTP